MTAPETQDGGLYAARQKIYPREIDGRFQRLRTIAVVGAARHLLRAAVDPVGRAAGGAVRPAGAQVPHLRADALAAGLLLPHLAAGDRGAGAVLLHRAGRAPVLRLRLPADRVDRDLPVDGAPGRGQPLAADEARQGAVERARRSCARAAKQLLWITFALWTGFTFVGYFTPITELARHDRELLDRALGDVLGAVLRRRHLRQRRASCASRSASTCARTRASRARCSTATR